MRQVGRVDQWYNQISFTPGGQPTNWRIIILQKFSHRSENFEPHVRPLSLGVWHRKEEPPGHLALKASGAWLQELHRTGGNRDFTLQGHTQNLACTRTQGKSSNLIGAWARPTCWSWRILRRGWDCSVAVAYPGDIDTGRSHICTM